jgi:hypothetical protein
MDCEKLTKIISDIGRRDWEFRQHFYGAKKPIEEIAWDKVLIERNIAEVKPLMEELEWKGIYEREWKKYDDGDILFEFESPNDELARNIDAYQNIDWFPDPKGIVFRYNDGMYDYFYLFREADTYVWFNEHADPFESDDPQTNLGNFQISRVDNSSEILQAQKELNKVPYADYSLGPYGLASFSDKTCSVHDGNVGEFQKNDTYAWRAHPKGYVVLPNNYDEGLILLGFYLNDDRQEELLTIEKDENLLDFQVGPAGIYTFYRNKQGGQEIRLNNEKIDEMGPYNRAFVHPDGLMITHDLFGHVYFIDKTGKRIGSIECPISAYKENRPGEVSVDDTDIKPYPGGAIVREKDGEKLRWVFRKMVRTVN